MFQCAWNTSNEEEDEFRSHCSSSCMSLTRADKGAVHTLQCGGGGGEGEFKYLKATEYLLQTFSKLLAEWIGHRCDACRRSGRS